MNFFVQCCYQYIFWNGVWAVAFNVMETLAAAVSTREEKPAYIFLRLGCLKAALRHFQRILHYDRHVRSRHGLPRLVLECTYAPDAATALGPRVVLHGDVTEHERDVVQSILDEHAWKSPLKYGPWVKVVSLKAHYAYDAIFYKLHALCKKRGGFFVGTVTNDPFCKGHLVCIGLEEDMRRSVLDVVKNASFHVVMQ